MPPLHEIRADYDRETLVVYQAYPAAIAKPAQWDPERSLRGAKQEHRSIQVGISRHRVERARRLQPKERPYPVSDDVAARLGMEA